MPWSPISANNSKSFNLISNKEDNHDNNTMNNNTNWEQVKDKNLYLGYNIYYTWEKCCTIAHTPSIRDWRSYIATNDFYIYFKPDGIVCVDLSEIKFDNNFISINIDELRRLSLLRNIVISIGGSWNLIKAWKWS